MPVRAEDRFRWVRPIAVLLLVCLALSAAATTLTGRVVAIADGDTLTALDAHKVQHKIRLAGIDAPEKRQAYGQRSRQSLADLVFNRVVQIELGKKDRYGRGIGKVMLDGQDINLELLRLGLAWHYKAYAREQSVQDRALYAQAEQQARADRLGLWRDARAIPPWDFRQTVRTARSRPAAAPALTP